MSSVIESPAVARPAPDLAAIKQRQQATWASGDYAVVGTTLQIVGEMLAEAADIRAGERVLDVAAGNGNASLACARRYARVTSTDYVASLLDKGRERARAEALDVEFRAADAEDLPFADDTFDAVISTFGCMFTPDHAQVAREMMRVTRSGGRVAMANWTPEGFVGRLFKLVGSHVPPPAGSKSPALWGTEPHLRDLFGSDMAEMAIVRRQYKFRYRSAAHWLQVFRDFYGPTHKAFGALDGAGQERLTRDLIALLDELNTADDSLVLPSDYVEVVVTKR
jgi:ubiquinone/menaquinone biosynthesis C-methylase UbiE